MPLGDLLAAIEKDFGSFDIFRAEMTAKTIAVEGSGWGWLVSGFYSLQIISDIKFLLLQGYEKGKDRLIITTCSNQDPLQATTGELPSTHLPSSDTSFSS